MIIYDRIKGLSQSQKKADGTEPSGDEVVNNGLFTYITFPSKYPDPSKDENKFSADFLPEVSYSIGPDNSSTATNLSVLLGKMITSAAEGQSIDKDFTFNGRVDVKEKF